MQGVKRNIVQQSMWDEDEMSRIEQMTNGRDQFLIQALKMRFRRCAAGRRLKVSTYSGSRRNFAI